ncbi:uncharacterized protein [Palaemon carinicauda]|uniref:uncharacterized protein isoform X2 n=1 Tax=Palaemon carinicauda TaxID=392227 RepID=UPI0035B5F40F
MSSFWSSVRRKGSESQEKPPSGRSSRSASRGKENEAPKSRTGKGRSRTSSRDVSADDECSSKGDDWSNRSMDGGSSRGDDFSSRGNVSREGDAGSMPEEAATAEGAVALEGGAAAPVEEAEDKNEGCLNVSKIAGQVLGRGGGGVMRVGLLPAFTKSGKTGSLPHHASSKQSVEATPPPPTPPPTPAAASECPAVPESPKPKIKGLGKKRAASVSPSRDKRRSFRGISRDRFPQLPQMPQFKNMPQMPQFKNMPQMPQFKNRPHMPSMPQFKNRPHMPNLPPLPKPKSLPKVPSMPKLPSFPRAPSLPRAPTLPRAPSLPPQLRNFLHRGGHSSADKEVEQPNKPSRRPGPVGRTWVKVYDDITFMDSETEKDDIYPVLAYTGRPHSVPEAEPLPVPPTPPPPKAHRQPSVESEYDNVPSASKEGTGEASSIEATPIQGRGRGRFKNKKPKRTGTPVATELDGVDAAMLASLEAQIIPAPEEEDDYIIPQALQPPRPPRGYKIYDKIEQPKQATTQEAEAGQEEPAKPPRGIKVYEDIIVRRHFTKLEEEKTENVDAMKQDEEKQEQKEEMSVLVKEDQNEKEEIPKEEENMEVEEQKETLSVEAKSEKVEEEVAIEEVLLPPRPQRGIKLYDTIEFQQKKAASEVVPAQEKEDQKQVASEAGNTEESKELPPKPARGNKIYASVLIESQSVKKRDISEVKETDIKTESVETETKVEPMETEIKVEAAEMEMKPVTVEEEVKIEQISAIEAGDKIETKVEESTVNTEAKMEISTSSEVNIEKKPETESIVIVKEVHTEITEVKPQVDVTTADTNKEVESQTKEEEKPTTQPPEIMETIPPYARVHKEAGIKELRPVYLDDDDETPPPIPPKKKGIRTISPQTLEMDPPRPPRHLKPRTRKSLIMVNGELPARPPRGNKIYADVEVVTPAPPKRHSKVVRIEEVVTHIKNEIDASTSLTSIQRGAPPPRRRRGKDTLGQQVTGTLTVDPSQPARISMTTECDENYENVTLSQEPPKRSRGRPLPPPPPPPKKSKLRQQQQQLTHSTTSSESPRESGRQVGQPISTDTGSPTIVTLRGGSVGKTAREAVPTTTSESDRITSIHSTTERVTHSPESKSRLESDIDSNLKTIENSFAALDNVLKSLQTYSGDSGERSSLREELTKTSDSSPATTNSLASQGDVNSVVAGKTKEEAGGVSTPATDTCVTSNVSVTEKDVLRTSVTQEAPKAFESVISSEPSLELTTNKSDETKSQSATSQDFTKGATSKTDDSKGKTVYETLYRVESVKKERRPVKDRSHTSEDQTSKETVENISKEQKIIFPETSIISAIARASENRKEDVAVKPFKVEEELLNIEEQLLRVEEQLGKVDQPVAREKLFSEGETSTTEKEPSVVKTEEQPVQVEELKVKTDETLETGEHSLKTEEEPKVEEQIIKAEELSVKPEEQAVKVEELSVKPGEHAVKVEEHAVKVEEQSVKVEELSIKAEEIPIKTDDQDLKVEEQSVKPEEISIKSEEQNIKGEEQTIKVDEQPVKSEEQAVKSEEQAVKSEQQPLESEEQPAKVEEPPVKLEEQPIKSEEQAANVEEPTVTDERKSVQIEEQEVKKEAQIDNVEEQIVKVDEPASVKAEEQIKTEITETEEQETKVIESLSTEAGSHGSDEALSHTEGHSEEKVESLKPEGETKSEEQAGIATAPLTGESLPEEIPEGTAVTLSSETGEEENKFAGPSSSTLVSEVRTEVKAEPKAEGTSTDGQAPVGVPAEGPTQLDTTELEAGVADIASRLEESE